MASYNHERWIRARPWTACSDRPSEDTELIVVDDASRDDSVSVLAGISDPRLRVYRLEHNCGGAAALNVAVQQARAELVAVINSDDEWEPEKLAIQVQLMDDDPDLTAAFTGAALIDETGAPIEAGTSPFDLFSQPDRTPAGWLRFFFENGNATRHPERADPHLILPLRGPVRPLPQAKIPDMDRWARMAKRHRFKVLGDARLTRVQGASRQRQRQRPQPGCRCAPRRTHTRRGVRRKHPRQWPVGRPPERSSCLARNGMPFAVGPKFGTCFDTVC